MIVSADVMEKLKIKQKIFIIAIMKVEEIDVIYHEA